MNKKLLLIFSLITLLVLTGCGNKDKNTENTESEKLTIYTTVYPLQYFAERIGTDHVDVQSVYPAGADEHTFDPTQKDMMSLAEADLFFYIGMGLEGFVENAEKTLKNENVKMIATSVAIPEESLEEGHDAHEDAEHEEHKHSSVDPHVWISPKLSVELASSIKDALIVSKPELKVEFEKNFEQLKLELNELDDKFKEMSLNAHTKTFFVSHASFGYLANSYGLKQVAIAGLNSQSEPSQKQLAKIVKEAKEHNVQYVLFEQNVSSKLTDVVRNEIGAESLMLHNLGVLTVDDVKNNETYFTLMIKNIETLEKALSAE